MAKNFLEDEAELSGEDVDSEDEEEEQGGKKYRLILLQNHSCSPFL